MVLSKLFPSSLLLSRDRVFKINISLAEDCWQSSERGTASLTGFCSKKTIQVRTTTILLKWAWSWLLARRNMMDGHDPPLPIHFTKKYFDKLPPWTPIKKSRPSRALSKIRILILFQNLICAFVWPLGNEEIRGEHAFKSLLSYPLLHIRHDYNGLYPLSRGSLPTAKTLRKQARNCLWSCDGHLSRNKCTKKKWNLKSDLIFL